MSNSGEVENYIKQEKLAKKLTQNSHVHTDKYTLTQQQKPEVTEEREDRQRRAEAN